MRDRIEQKAIIVGAVVGMIMAASGWLAYYLSGTEALLLDGNFSFIGVLATLVALRISVIKTRTNETFPFGQFVYEPAYSLLIALLTAGVILAAGVGNGIKIVNYAQGAAFREIDTTVILVYTIAMMVLCFGLAAFFGRSNRRLNGASTILGAYKTQSTIDGLLSAGAGCALILFGSVSPDGAFGFLTRIGDAIVVLLLCVSVMYLPIRQIRQSFVELSGGALNDPEATGKIRSVVLDHIEDRDIANLFISKTGSSYLVVAFLKGGFFDAQDSRGLLRTRQDVTDALKNDFEYVSFELTLAQGTEPSEPESTTSG